MLHTTAAGHLAVYVAKKDLEEDVVAQEDTPEGRVLTLANGWQLAIAPLPEPVKLPQTIEAKRLA